MPSTTFGITHVASKTKKTKQPLTTAQQLGTLIKSARDTMRKDKGLNGDLDRLPMLTWIMFLKFLDDLETDHEYKAELAGRPYKAIIQRPYRWRDWAADEKLTGDDLLHFVNDQEVTLPNGKKGPGLFQYLRQLRGVNGGTDQRDVIATIFKGVVNRMESGYLLREIVNKVNGIHFKSTEEIHTLGRLYESMLKEMRDAAGDSGEFYTPRPVIRFMVEVMNPMLGEKVLDPACGTGGFLVEAYNHLAKQAKTVQDRRILQEESILGGEAKSLPYLLAQMNLLLHGVETPRIDPQNSLSKRLTDIGDSERVDIILTNPPFGGEEEKGIQGNFPEDKRTAETALLFLQLIMRKLRKHPKPGRAAVVVPNGTLFGDGVCARIKEELLKNFNLHTVVRLPNGVFSPYTNIPANLLFFDRSGPTENIWYYEQPLPEGRKNYTKTQPLQYEAFGPCIAWWNNRAENGSAWKVNVTQVLKYDPEKRLLSANLDLKNPNGKQDLEHLPAVELAESIITKERKVLEILEAIKNSLQESA
jgi:type I restriction enzyme M protein